MKIASALLLLVGLNFNVVGQTYFPPLTAGTWAAYIPQELGWCQENIDTLLSYAEARNSKSLIILVDGKIAIEAYFNGHSQSDFWYWASAGKTLAATLTGIAQEEGELSIADPVSQYIGEGWTACDTEDELQRTIWHQLTMSSSFNNSPFLWDCTEPWCFLCSGLEAGTQWHYHNGVYRKLHEVLENATGMSMSGLTQEKVSSKIGMFGLWTDDQLFLSTTRSMARFGLLALNNFVWDGDTVLHDQSYIQSMVTPSQELNRSYGYLWWLNGQESHYLPVNPDLLDGPIIPDAPADLYAGLGANDQKVYVVPSLNMVVVRMGDQAYASEPSVSAFDNELWQLILNLPCAVTDTENHDKSKAALHVFPNPASGSMKITDPAQYKSISVHDLDGKLLLNMTGQAAADGFFLPRGIYLIKAESHLGIPETAKIIFY